MSNTMDYIDCPICGEPAFIITDHRTNDTWVWCIVCGYEKAGMF